jgi:hypothetical protein
VVDRIDLGGEVRVSGGAGRVLRAAEGELGERSFGRVAAGGEDPAGDVVDGVEDDRADSVGRGAHRGEREARSVARAVDVPLVVAQRGADRVEIANVGLGVVVVEVDPSGLQPGAAARVRLDDRRSFDLERIGALQVPQPHLVPFGAVEGGECLARAALVVEHDVAVRVRPELRGGGRRTAGAAGRHHDGIGA